MPTEDGELGGKYDILLPLGVQSEDSTTITFRRKLQTNDKYDVPISDKQVYVVWTYCETDGNVKLEYTKVEKASVK